MNTLLLASLVVVLSAWLAWQNSTLLTAVETQQRSLNQLLREGTNTPKSDTQPQTDEVSRLKRELAQAQHRLAQVKAQVKAQASWAPSCPPAKAKRTDRRAEGAVSRARYSRRRTEFYEATSTGRSCCISFCFHEVYLVKQ
jgi:hypothetical protein